MKLKTIYISSIFFLAISSLVFTACTRERDFDTSDGEETILMERNADDVFSIVNQAATGDVSQFKKDRGCATITHDTLSNPKTLIVDFGLNNCLCNDGKLRRGKIVTTYTGAFKANNNSRTTTFLNYFVNDNQVKGIKTVVNKGINTSGILSWTITNVDTLVLPSNAGSITYQSNLNREMTAGMATNQWTDDRFSVTGSGSGIRANKNTWSMAITKPLTIDHSCIYRMVGGTIQYQPQAKSLRSLEYGDGACDNNATITINNKVIAIKFK
jgi:hypothetical protein